MPQAPGQRPGFFAVEREGTTIGVLTLDARAADRPYADALDLGYLFLPAHWGQGYAAEAAAAVLDWLALVRPGGRVLATTQSANERSMRLAARLGFTEPGAVRRLRRGAVGRGAVTQDSFRRGRWSRRRGAIR
ncbi:GNAT family N-acetyltransferase [Nocardioides convexus]|uniref:GNAT family N-acetyltransferase n=1 Tax=Nocardioides convexus TaxID=2712224 RepID=UPI002418B087|nr:GNAT family N-acetyltransferase [Nocardioides convexus]